MAAFKQPNCPDFAVFNDFGDYVKLLRSETGFRRQPLHQCQTEICSALWGTGNPDISGIGVSCLPATNWNID